MFLATAVFAVTTMIVIPTGAYQPLYGSAKVHVASFSMDARAVTRDEFLKFVTTHPQWRRSAVPRTLADASYLEEWASDLDVANTQRPVTSISRYAAEAYCAAKGKRLPSVDEWEYALSISAKAADLPPHGGPWEWTAAPHERDHHARDAHDASCAGAALGAQDPTNYTAFQRFALRSVLSNTSTLRTLGFRCAA